MHHSFASIKKLFMALGVAGIGALVGLPALAQSSDSLEGAPEFELSKEGYIILCDRTPLNSRCEGSPYYTGQSPFENPAASPSGTTAPTQFLPSDSDETDIPRGQPSDGVLQDGSSDDMMQDGSSDDMMQDDSSSDQNGDTDPSGTTTAPTETLPSDSENP